MPYSRSGRPPSRTMHLGICSVSGRRRIPWPAASIIAWTGTPALLPRSPDIAADLVDERAQGRVIDAADRKPRRSVERGNPALPPTPPAIVRRGDQLSRQVVRSLRSQPQREGGGQFRRHATLPSVSQTPDARELVAASLLGSQHG